MGKPKIFFGIAIYRHYETASLHSIHKLIKERKNWDLAPGDFIELWEQSNLVIARNYLVEKFLNESTADYLFFFDVDLVSFTERAIDLLVADNKPIVGAAYIMKKDPAFPVFVPYDVKDFDLRNKKETFEVKYTPGGFMLMRRDVIQAIRKKYQMPVSTEIRNNEYITDDWIMNERGRECGFKSYLNPNIILGHLGMYPFSMLDFYQKYIDNSEVKNFMIQGREFIK